MESCFPNEAYYVNLMMKIVFYCLRGIIELLILSEICQSATSLISLYQQNASKNKSSFVVTLHDHVILRVNSGGKKNT